MQTPAPTREVLERIDNYRPHHLTSVAWENHADEIRSLTIGAKPTSPIDAAHLLGAVSHFTAWLEHNTGTISSIEFVLTDRAINTFAAHLATTYAEQTVANETRRLQRVKEGVLGFGPLPGLDRSAVRTREMTPLTAEQVTALRALQGRTAEILNMMLTTGIGPAEASQHEQGFTRQEWVKARKEAEAVGVPITAAQIRITWAHNVAASMASTSQLVAMGLSPWELTTISRCSNLSVQTVTVLSSAR